jgi:asparagine synthase (glutamine-hydrolysing)
LTWHRDAPISEPADIAVFKLAELARRSVTVVLSGEGSDELFGGYPKHLYARATSLAGIFPAALRHALLGALERHAPARGARIRIALRALSEFDQPGRIRGWFAPFTGVERDALLRGAQVHPEPRWLQIADGDALRRMLLTDVQTWLPDNLLERGDRMSMAASLELRPPFLDRRVVELAFSLPSQLKVRNRTTKRLVKEVALRYLPDSIVNRPKVGFRVPLDAWFRGRLEAFAWDTLTSQGSFIGAIFDRVLVRQLLERHRRKSADEAIRIWTLLCLEIWHDQFFGKPSTGIRKSPETRVMAS